VFPNCNAKLKGERNVLVGADLLDVRDVSALALRRPVDRGYIVAWDLQREIWARSLRSLAASAGLPPLAACAAVLTEPYLNLPALRDAALQVAFGDLGLGAVALASPAALAARWHLSRHPNLPAAAAGCALVLDLGFSFTHAVPVFDFRVVPAGVRRIDLGGKALTNLFKELVSYRSVNVMNETYLVEHIKEQVCFVSQDVGADLVASRGRAPRHRVEYVLPDGITSTWGRIRSSEEAAAAREGGGGGAASKEAVLLINNERFMVPEALFHPTDVGMDEAGLAEAAAAAVQACHPHLHALLWSCVVLVGGTARCPGIKERLERELRPLVPDDYQVRLEYLCPFL
jgi:actin-related protein 6